MMPRGAYRAKGLGVLAIAHASDRIAGGPCSQGRCIPRTGRYHRIGFNSTSPLLAPSMQLIKIHRSVIRLALLDGRCHPVGFGTPLQPTISLEHRSDL